MIALPLSDLEKPSNVIQIGLLDPANQPTLPETTYKKSKEGKCQNTNDLGEYKLH